MDDIELLTYGEAGKLAGVSHETIRKWVRDHNLPYFPMPGSSRKKIPRAALIEFVKKRQVCAKFATN